MFAELLTQRLAAIIKLRREQVAQLEKHFELLLRWNDKLSLTTITGLEEAVERHYCESLFAGSLLPAGALRIVDVGTGAGFPGLPIAVLRPECSIALVESHARKAVFLREACRDLPNVRVLRARAEGLTERFDWAVSRAVSYRDLRRSLKSLADSADLLTGAEDPGAVLTEFIWQNGIPLPWGARRFVRIGGLRPDVAPVSRETIDGRR